MSVGSLKITKFCWANTIDLQEPTWKDCPIQSPYWSRRWEYPWVLQQANVQEGMTMVDAGSGNMNPLPVFLDSKYNNIKVYAVDLVPSPFPDTRQVKTVQEDLTRTSIASDSVDIVVCVSVLEHMEPQDWARGIKEFCRILKPQGKIVVTLDVEADPRCNYHFKNFELDHFIKTIDPTATIPPRPHDLLTSLTGSLPGEKDLHLTVLGFVAQVI